MRRERDHREELRRGGRVPANTKIGHASLLINARPAVKTLVTGTAGVYNGLDDVSGTGFLKGSAVLALDVHTSVGVSTIFFFHVSTKGGRVVLIANESKPAKRGIAPGTFTIQHVDLTFDKAELTAPKTCSGGWDFAMTIRSYFGAPSVTAHDRVPCRT